MLPALALCLVPTTLHPALLQDRDAGSALQPPAVLAPVDELVSQREPLDGPLTPERRSELQESIDSLNARWADVKAQQHQSILDLAEEKLARGPDDVFEGRIPSLSPGAIGRRLLFQQGTQVAVDVFAGESEDLDQAVLELQALHEIAGELVDGYFARPREHSTRTQGPGTEPIGGPDCECEFTTQYTDGDPAPDCLASWGITYSVDAGVCDLPGCLSPRPCSGTVTISMTEAPGESCDVLSVGIWSSVGPYSQPMFDGSFSVATQTTIDCGERIVLIWGADGVSLGQTEMKCNECKGD